ncbi:MAG: hypothetical protein Q8M66_09110 [Actinomycetota bacterium]|nr:hypothetical protein [Actinomycetota bacterium]MDZ4178248.1 hypothetical protein [Coriobacteriia bacterium]
MSAPHTYRYRRTREAFRTRLLLGILCAIVGGALAIGTSGAGGAEMSVHVRINPTVAATFEGGGVTVRANTPWRLEASVPGQPIAVQHAGSPTSGTYVPLPAGASELSVVADG